MLFPLCRYTLNTCVDPPHNQPVTSITFQPRHHANKSSNQVPLLVSTSSDGHFKVWVLLSERVEECGSWACRAVGYYHGLECVGAAFSEDGSVLAVNCKTVSQHSRLAYHCFLNSLSLSFFMYPTFLNSYDKL